MQPGLKYLRNGSHLADQGRQGERDQMFPLWSDSLRTRRLL